MIVLLLCVLHTPDNALIAKDTCHNGIGTNCASGGGMGILA